MNETIKTGNNKSKLDNNVEKFKWAESNGGDFMKKLCKTIRIADMENTVKLHKAFPELVDGHTGLKYGMSFDDLQVRILESNGY